MKNDPAHYRRLGGWVLVFLVLCCVDFISVFYVIISVSKDPDILRAIEIFPSVKIVQTTIFVLSIIICACISAQIVSIFLRKRRLNKLLLYLRAALSVILFALIFWQVYTIASALSLTVSSVYAGSYSLLTSALSIVVYAGCWLVYFNRSKRAAVYFLSKSSFNSVYG